MSLANNSLLSMTSSNSVYMNSTVEIYTSSSFSIIITIIILSVLSLSGWIFMSYALFGRSEAYRAKPEDYFGTSNLTDASDGKHGTDLFFDI